MPPGFRVMVSAGAAGVGRAAVEGFARAGARVHICDAALGHFVTADDIANIILFLCTPQARNFSGQAIAVCAGTTDMT